MKFTIKSEHICAIITNARISCSIFDIVKSGGVADPVPSKMLPVATLPWLFLVPTLPRLLPALLDDLMEALLFVRPSPLRLRATDPCPLLPAWLGSRCDIAIRG